MGTSSQADAPADAITAPVSFGHNHQPVSSRHTSKPVSSEYSSTDACAASTRHQHKFSIIASLTNLLQEASGKASESANYSFFSNRAAAIPNMATVSSSLSHPTLPSYYRTSFTSQSQRSSQHLSTASSTHGAYSAPPTSLSPPRLWLAVSKIQLKDTGAAEASTGVSTYLVVLANNRLEVLIPLSILLSLLITGWRYPYLHPVISSTGIYYVVWS
ncbi:hypothetical protein F0562_007134 [Nyssa sinensis]|uniref:Uncharacterized protein n=1 Tax=Nyssa sinensis TaxID=561372 RepID=A0A5J5A4I3_9ASTE|nr:hypothetical protein F0562_007134 [Nyssa sinensis]